MKNVCIYDSTLRDGVQMASVNFSRQDKLKIIQNLVDELGFPYIELYPSSNPKDQELIKYITENQPKYLKNLVAFGSTRRVNIKPENDDNIKKILDSGLKTACIFGKSWDFHLPFIHATPEQNLLIIEDTIAYLKKQGLTVFYDAEHFFDGYRSNSDYAIQTLKAAEKGGAEIIILCDTNGGSLPHDVYDITEIILKEINTPLGIHAHHDAGMGNANSIAAVKACLNANRACQVQGCMNGLGERTGNANLTTIIPVMVLKMNIPVVTSENLKNLTSVSHLIYELTNIVPPLDKPFIGYNAFSHKGGMHIAAMEKDLKSYEHIDPDTVGNKRRVLISEMSGRSAVLHKCKKFGIDLTKDDPLLPEILKVLKRKESHGYSYEGADASFEILIRSMMKDPKQESAFFRTHFFEVDYFRIIDDVRNVFDDDELEIITDANIRMRVWDEEGRQSFHTAAGGNGPINALDKALRKALLHFYPVLEDIELIDFKVRISNTIELEKGTASRVRVLVETRDRKDNQTWGTIGSHVNIIVASFVALLDSYVYKLMKEGIVPYKKNNGEI
ncbi:MAG: citramalate synthase [archaeon]|nr:citramalate synthase [archaeon]